MNKAVLAGMFLTIVLEAAVAGKLYKERLTYDSAYMACSESLNYVEHKVLTHKQKWRLDGFLKRKETSAAR